MPTHSLGRYAVFKNAARRLGMDERDLEPEEAEARLLVDQVDAVGLQPLQLPGDVVALEGDVVHAGAALREEPAHRRVGPERPEQLDARAGDRERRRLDPLVLEALPVLDGGAEEDAVGRDRSVQIVDRDPDVVDP